MDYIPNQGDVVWLNFNPQAGNEQAGRRPALILTPARYNGKVGLAILCPITNQEKGYPFEVKIPTGLAVTGVILADHVKNLDWRIRQAEFICKLPKVTVKEVLRKLTVLLKVQNQ
jgi:mRNA interferase MazF